ncbi:MAG: DUF3108 domain-containing protein [Burkholderiaceae bacterium]|nr:DUF3108 domain-containing protein [Burkholderiaceae bacterium]
MTVYAPVTAAPRPRLALITLFVLAAHALLLLGLPRWSRTVPVTGGPPVFQIRTITLAPPQSTVAAPQAQPVPAPPVPAAPEPLRPKPRPRPEPLPAPDGTSGSPVADNPPPSGTANLSDGRPLPVITVANPQPSAAPADAADAHLSLLQAPPLVTFGGKTPPPPIAPPLPPDQILAIQQQAAQPGLAGSAAPDARTPGTPDAIPPVQLPRPAQITYQATLTQNGRRVALPSTIDWRQDGQSYNLMWTLYGPAIGDHSRYATGLVTVRGLAPVTAYALGPEGYNLTFDYAQARLRSGSPPASAPGAAASETAASEAADAASAASQSAAANETADTALPPGAQDPLSLLLELGALIAGDPARYPVGSRIALPLVDGGGIAPQPASFTVMDGNGFIGAGQFAGQQLQALHLAHQSTGNQDARIELWLGKQLDYLPLRLLIVQPDGSQLDMTLQSAYTQTVPLAPALPASSPASASSSVSSGGDSPGTR